MMDTLTVLRDARAMLSEGRWCKGQLDDGNGNHCAIGAVSVAGSGDVFGDDYGAINALAAALTRGQHAYGVVNFNNEPATTLADILALFDRAIAAEEAKLQPEVVPQVTPRRRASVGCETRERVVA